MSTIKFFARNKTLKMLEKFILKQSNSDSQDLVGAETGNRYIYTKDNSPEWSWVYPDNSTGNSTAWINGLLHSTHKILSLKLVKTRLTGCESKTVFLLLVCSGNPALISPEGFLHCIGDAHIQETYCLQKYLYKSSTGTHLKKFQATNLEYNANFKSWGLYRYI